MKSLYGKGFFPNPQHPDWNPSMYFMRVSDEYYQKTALRDGWWPQFNPYALGEAEEFPELYTEYWYNDFTSSLVQGQQTTALTDGQGQPLPAMNGGRVDKIPFAAYAVPMAEYGWFLPPAQLRHRGGFVAGFLDGRAERRIKKKYYDLDGRPASASDRPEDVDPYGTRPFYAWGLSKYGRDFLR